MTLWKLILAYDGTLFHGWQIQPMLPTIQGTLARAILHITGERVLPQGSGRTDAGVHALGQVSSFSIDAPIPPANFHRALNRALPSSIRVLSAQHAPSIDPPFHARHSALSKTYEYRIHPASPDRICPPTLAPYVYDCPSPICLPLAQQAAAQILGTHDFTSFAASDPDLTIRRTQTSSTHPQSPGAPSQAVSSPEMGLQDFQQVPSTTRTILHSAFTLSEDPPLILYRITGTGFLHHMVRNLVGTFLEIAATRLPPDAIPSILAARSRAAAGPTAPARGLFLVSVEYPEPVSHP